MEIDTDPTTKPHKVAKTARLEARVTVDQKQLMERAACLRGQNLTEFMISVLADAATQTIKDRELIKLTDLERQKIIGYYTLSMSGINLEQLPEAIINKLPKYPIVGVTLISRLAVDRDYKGFGWGKLIIMDAFQRSLNISKATGFFAVVVEAIDDDAVRFYQRFDFKIFPDCTNKLFQTMKSVPQIFV